MNAPCCSRKTEVLRAPRRSQEMCDILYLYAGCTIGIVISSSERDELKLCTIHRTTLRTSSIRTFHTCRLNWDNKTRTRPQKLPLDAKRSPRRRHMTTGLIPFVHTYCRREQGQTPVLSVVSVDVRTGTLRIVNAMYGCSTACRRLYAGMPERSRDVELRVVILGLTDEKQNDILFFHHFKNVPS